MKNQKQNEIEIDTNETKSKVNKGRGYDVTQSVFYLRQSSVHDNTHSYNKNNNKNKNRNETNQKEFSDKIEDLNLSDLKDRISNHNEGNATNIDNGSHQSAKDERTTLFINTSMLVPPFTEEVCI